MRAEATHHDMKERVGEGKGNGGDTPSRLDT